jgi:histidinol-phosphate aminotransferase
LASVEKLKAERARLADALRAFEGLTVYPSESNFILCRLVSGAGLDLKRALEREGILVRYFDKPGLRDCIRISVGRPQDTDALVNVLRHVMREA